MRGEIITIGDELLSGRVCDVNSFFLSGRAFSYGLTIQAITSVGDDPERIIEVLERAAGRSDFVLVSGGLGPTEDDLTTVTAARFLRVPLIQDEAFLDSLKQSLSTRNIAWVDSYRKLAMLPKGAEFIDPQGEACGFYVKTEQAGRPVPVFFLPGVPAEVRRLVEKRVLPLLLQHQPDRLAVRQRLFKLFGLQEAEIGEILADLGVDDENVLIGFYPNFPETHVTVTVRDPSAPAAEETLERIAERVTDRLGRYLTAVDDQTLAGNIGALMTERGLTLAVAESCTGGLISRWVTSVSGSSAYFDRGVVAYSNAAKEEMLGVPHEVLVAHGAVSRPAAKAMAAGVRRASGADIGLATTGIAGPTGGTDEKPVGTVFVALASGAGVRVERFQFNGDRDQVTMLTAETGLLWVLRCLNDDSFVLRH